MVAPAVQRLPPGVAFIERGWLSSNSVLMLGRSGTALVDSGYGSHARQTAAIVAHALGGRELDLLVNTHLHSDHCGGNRALQEQYPDLHTVIPPGQAEQVRVWDEEALTYSPTGQICPQFVFDAVLEPGREIRLGDGIWQAHAAAGHDPHSIILFEPKSRTLISADALWENGFGVVFPELEGDAAFAEVGATLDLIESLAPLTVIPGHGPVFSDVGRSLGIARQRLDRFISHPASHAKHAAKVLIKFLLLDQHVCERSCFLAQVSEMDYLKKIRLRHFAEFSTAQWLDALLQELVASGVARQNGRYISN